MQKAKLGPDHPDTLMSMSNLAVSYARAGQNDRALKLAEETLALHQGEARRRPSRHVEMSRSSGPMPGESRAARPRRCHLRPGHCVASEGRGRRPPRYAPSPADPRRARPGPAAGSTPPLRPIGRSWTNAGRGSAPTTGPRSPPGSPWPGCDRREAIAMRPRRCTAPRWNRPARTRATARRWPRPWRNRAGRGSGPATGVRPRRSSAKPWQSARRRSPGTG